MRNSHPNRKDVLKSFGMYRYSKDEMIRDRNTNYKGKLLGFRIKEEKRQESFQGFPVFYFGDFSIRVRHLEKDTVEMIFPFFPFLFWRFWVCEGNTLMRYCRNDFSLFFPFSVFPSKSFFFIFSFFCVCHRIIRRKKKTKNYFFGGKREKGKK